MMKLGSLDKWFIDKGDFTHNLNYDLNENSIVIDIGGYTGNWVSQIIDKYNPYVYIVEPVPNFYNHLVSKFSNNPKISLLDVGLSDQNIEGTIYISGDASSSNEVNGESKTVKFLTIESIMNIWGIEGADLIQINIEGDEYKVLEHMVNTGLVNKFKNIQVQFHLGVENDVVRRELIQNKLIKHGFKNKFNYPFVWESWYK